MSGKKFTFWKENKTDQEYSLTVDEIKDKYRAFLELQDLDWIMYYGHAGVNFFVGDEKGLNSVTDQENYQELQELLMDVRHNYVDELNKKR